MPTNLPTAPNAFVGRESDVEELLGLLGAARLVTLCGTGGIGKTRLALRVASEAVETFSDGVWLVELGDLESGEGLDDRVAFALGVPVEELSGALTGGHQLLVFDNCEHLVDSCAELCTRLLASCPDLRVLATSREPLRVAGETVWRVPPLSLLAEKPVGSDAVRLFVQRSEAATGEQQWTAADDEAVASLCAELEGIPLAIELAAAMTRVLSVEQIRSRLSDRFKLLTSGSRSAPVRQRTLLATVEWSYRMLGGPAQALLRRLTVFRGGWTLWMAESVCPGDGLEPDEVLTTMAELVDKSLVIADARFGGEIRYRMLDTIRDYAGQRLREEGGQAEAELRQRHLECMRAAAARGAVLLTTATKDNWAETLRFFHAIDAVQPNFYAAMAHALTTGQVEQVLHITADLQWALVGGGRFDEATRYIDRALEVAADVPKGVIGQATGVRALLCFYGGDLEGMIGHAGRGLELSRADGNLPGEITCTLLLLLASWEGLTFDGAAELADRYGDTYFKAFVVYGRALVAQLNGQLREAQRQYEAMLEVLRESTEWGSAQAVIGLAQLAHARGDLGGAVHHYEHAQRLLHALDYRGDRIRCLTGLGKIAIELGDFDSARSRLAESLSLSTGLGQRAAAVELVEAFTELAHREGDQQRAVRLAAASTALRERMGGALAGGAGARTEEVLAPARRDLGEAVVARLWREGLELPWHRTIDYALSGQLAAPPAPAGPQLTVPRDSTLTEREREIVVLIARGLSNRQLAEELIISPATVARHVSNILGKLGFGSRTQVAAWAVEHGLNE